jgi:hypothetical protein
MFTKMSVKQKQCWECKQPVYTIEGKFAGSAKSGQFIPFTNKDGTPKLQEYNDMDGKEAHFNTCPVKQARRLAQRGENIAEKVMQPTRAQQLVRESAQLAANNLQERADTYVPAGYVQDGSNKKISPQTTEIVTPMPPAEPAVLTQIQTTLEAIQTMLSIMKRDQELMNERIDVIQHNLASE